MLAALRPRRCTKRCERATGDDYATVLSGDLARAGVLRGTRRDELFAIEPDMLLAEAISATGEALG